MTQEYSPTNADTSSPDPEARISILIPCYNAGDYLEPAVDSALRQMARDDVVIVQDACSTDGSREFLESVAAKDDRVRVVSESDGGQSDALNRCLARVDTDWCLWLNADDLIIDGGLAAIRGAIEANPDVEVVVGCHQIIRADGSVVDTFTGRPLDVDRMIGWGCSAFSGSIAARTELLRRIGGFDDQLNTVMDLDLQLRMAAVEPRQITIPEVVGALRFHELSKTANLWRQFVSESHRIRFEYADTVSRRLVGARATLLHLASVAVFRIRLTPQYRRARSRVVRCLRR